MKPRIRKHDRLYYVDGHGKRRSFEGTLVDSAYIEGVEKELIATRDSFHALRSTIVSEVGGLVEGNITHTGNYLQRIRELRRIESQVAALAATFGCLCVRPRVSCVGCKIRRIMGRP